MNRSIQDGEAGQHLTLHNRDLIYISPRDLSLRRSLCRVDPKEPFLEGEDGGLGSILKSQPAI
jgi:hypothetical protein